MATAAPHIRDLAKQQRRNLRALLLAVLVILVAVLLFAGHRSWVHLLDHDLIDVLRTNT